MKSYSKDEHVKIVCYADLLEHTQVSCDKSAIKEMYLNANSLGISLDTKIYRIFSYKWLLQAFRTKTLYFVRPEVWDDPYENYLLRSKGVLPNGIEVGLDSVKNKVFAQCWSTKAECDGLWRNYSTKVGKRRYTKDISVKVETTVGKLFDEFYNIDNKFHVLSYFVGKVRYVSDRTIRKYLKRDVLTDTTAMGPVLALLTKRKAFSYENEVRFIFYDSNDSVKPYYLCPFDSSIVDRVTIEPWASDNQIKKITKELSKHYSGVIEHDSLYKEPHLTIKL